MNIKYILELNKVKSSSAYFNEIYVHKHFNGLYNDIILHNEIYNMNNHSFKAKIYNYEFNITEIPKCKNCDKNTNIDRMYDNGYILHCSQSCRFEYMRKNPIITAKKSKTKDILLDVDIIAHIKENPTRLRENYIRDNFITFYNNIFDYIKNNHIIINQNKDIFIQQLYYYVNNIKETIICSECDNITSFGDSFNDGYRPYCSSLCREKNISTKIKREQTCEVIYGVNNAAKADSTKIKKAETNNRIYGATSSFQNTEVRKKWSDNVFDKYGVSHIFQVDDIKNDIKNSHIIKYGDWYTKSKKYQDIITENNQLIYNTDDISLLDYDSPHAELFNKQCGHEFIITSNTFKRRKADGLVICTICNPINDNISYAEAEVLEFIKSLGIADISPSNRSVLKGRELDIYLPSHNFAIEYNGLYWHSEIYRDSEYHLNKTKMCNDNGIELFHLWEDLWIYKKDIVKSIIRERLGLPIDNINVNDCIITLINDDEAQQFFNNNYLDDISCGDINIGLLYNGRIVSMLSILTTNEKVYVAIGFANILNTSIHYSTQKLFDYFISNYEYAVINAQVDISQMNSNIYEKLGFVNIDNIQPICKLFSTNDYKRVDIKKNRMSI